MSEQDYPGPLQDLIDVLKTLPGIGGRSAERIAFAVLGWPVEKLDFFGDTVKNLRKKISFCPDCGNLSEENRLCRICSSHSRDKSVICVVEEPVQIKNIEKSATYKGLYHVLGGKIAPLEGRNPEDLSIDKLRERCNGASVTEIIIALSPDVEGQATSIYIANLFEGSDIKVSMLARGLPAGSDILYADSATIAAALSGRTLI